MVLAGCWLEGFLVWEHDLGFMKSCLPFIKVIPKFFFDFFCKIFHEMKWYYFVLTAYGMFLF